MYNENCSVITSVIYLNLPAGGWADEGYHVITVGKATSSVRSLTVVGNFLWAAYRNCVVIIDPKELIIVVSSILCWFFQSIFPKNALIIFLDYSFNFS